VATTSEKRLSQPAAQRLPGQSRTTRYNRTVRGLVERTEISAQEAREYNKTILPNHQEEFYMAGMNAIAETFWRLARNANSDPNELRLYADLLLKHFEQKIKKDKIKIMGRHLELLEAKAKALETAVRNARSPSELGAYVREVLFPQTNGHKVQTPLIEDRIAP
jgi:hypothetical protein